MGRGAYYACRRCGGSACASCLRRIRPHPRHFQQFERAPGRRVHSALSTRSTRATATSGVRSGCTFALAWRRPNQAVSGTRESEGASSRGDEIAAWCKGKIATYKIPRHWKFVDAFPMTVTGKIQKFKMRETSVEELGLEKAAGVRTA